MLIYALNTGDKMKYTIRGGLTVMDDGAKLNQKTKASASCGLKEVMISVRGSRPLESG